MVAGAVDTISVLIATYGGETSENLDTALRSVLMAQTHPPEECVLVVDGPVDDAQETVIDRHAKSAAGVLRVVRLPRNVGLAGALNAGLPHCTGTFVARMDSDDISMPQRFERQLEAFAADPSLDACFSWHLDFTDDPDKPFRVKESPPGHDEICARLKWRNCLSHPTMMVRRAALDAIGGYKALYGPLEDYDLFIRLAASGARLGAVQEPLVLFRTGAPQRSRRGGLGYARHEITFRAACCRSGYLTAAEFVATLSLYLVFRLLPPWAKGPLYRLVRSHPG